MSKKEYSKKVVPIIKKPNGVIESNKIPFLESPLRQILYALQRDRLAKEKAIQEAEKKFYEVAEIKLREVAEIKLREVAEIKLGEVAEIKLGEVDEIELGEIELREIELEKLDEKWPSLDHQCHSPFDDLSKKEIEIFDFITSQESIKNIIATRIQHSKIRHLKIHHSKIRTNCELVVSIETPTNTAQVSIDTDIPIIYVPQPSFIMKAFADPPLRSNLNFLNSL